MLCLASNNRKLFSYVLFYNCMKNVALLKFLKHLEHFLETGDKTSLIILKENKAKLKELHFDINKWPHGKITTRGLFAKGFKINNPKILETAMWNWQKLRKAVGTHCKRIRVNKPLPPRLRKSLQAAWS